jgi:diguanylate cyclase (GGDEF)-like protein
MDFAHADDRTVRAIPMSSPFDDVPFPTLTFDLGEVRRRLLAASEPDSEPACGGSRSSVGVRVVDANRRARGEVGADRDDPRVASVIDAVVDALAAVWSSDARPPRSIDVEAEVVGRGGRTAVWRFRLGACSGHEATWDRVVVCQYDDRPVGASALSFDGVAAEMAALHHVPIAVWLQDFSAVAATLEQLRSSGVRDLAALIDRDPEFVERCAAGISVIGVNPAAVDLVRGDSSDELIALAYHVLAGSDPEYQRGDIEAIWRGARRQRREAVVHALDGHPMYVQIDWSVMPGSEVTFDRVVIAVVDVSERKRSEDSMRYLSTHDELTGLANRSEFDSWVARLDAEPGREVSIVIADLNDLKPVNDLIGHAAGDHLLRRAATALRGASPESALVARIGGDEFAVVLPDVSAAGSLAYLERVRRAMQRDNRSSTGPELTMALGASSRGQVRDLATVCAHADEQMYADKIGHGRRRSDAIDRLRRVGR